MKKYLVQVHDNFAERILIDPSPTEKKFFTVKGAMKWAYKNLRMCTSIEGSYADVLDTTTGEVMIILSR